ncbi:DUF742 domain-containing protein [Actinocorallia longicatena]|uniref:DUF742 domain-containing protein n=1 Tax=Actinocorallia longicatena TaxID=111803 RepID=A0ABP6Q7K8_9ACTN
MEEQPDRWLEVERGPIVRPYALTRGRTEPEGEAFHLISVVQARVEPGAVSRAEPEHHLLLTLCQRPVSVVDLASDARLPLGVTRVLLGDLRHRGMIITRPAAARNDGAVDIHIIREVLNGLRAL